MILLRFTGRSMQVWAIYSHFWDIGTELILMIRCGGSPIGQATCDTIVHLVSVPGGCAAADMNGMQNCRAGMDRGVFWLAA